MKIIVNLYPPFRPMGESSEMEIELHEGAVLADLLEVLSNTITGFNKHLPKSRENNILWGNVVPISNGNVIGYKDTLEDGCTVKLFSAFCGG